MLNKLLHTESDEYAGEHGKLLHRYGKLDGEIEIIPFVTKLSRYFVVSIRFQ
jgi:hypothetical protein